MSCEECDRDPVMDLLEALALSEGYRLEPMTVPEPDDFQEQMKRLRTEFETMPLDELAAQVAAYKREAKDIDAIDTAWIKDFKERLSQMGRYISEPEKRRPEMLRKALSTASTLAAMAENVLINRIASDTLAEITAKPPASQPAA